MRSPASRPPEPEFVGDLHIDRPIVALDVSSRYAAARLLVRLHGRPVGGVRLPLRGGRLSASSIALAVWDELSQPIVEHLIADEMAPSAELPVEGMASVSRPRDAACWVVPRASANPTITVVIATRNRTASLLRTLRSVGLLDYPAYDVVVVDSDPRDDETHLALAGGMCGDLPVTYLRTDRPGLAHAHNTALTAVTGQVVAFTDDDVEVDPLWLAAIAQSFAQPAVACVTGLILPAELETPAQVWIEQAGGFSRGSGERQFSLGRPSADPLFPFSAGRFGSGANMSFRASWLRRNGGFDPATGAGSRGRGGDDLTAFLQVVLDGRVLTYQPAAIVRHWHRREYVALRRQSFGYGVGLSAFLTAAAWSEPRLLPALAARTGPALSHLLSATSEKNRGKDTDFPVELTWLERAGLVTGPFAYAASRWATRKVSSRSVEAEAT